MSRLPAFLLGLVLLDCLASPALAQPMVGGVFEYTVVKGDYLIRIGARFGVDPQVLARDNGLEYSGILRPGLRLRVDNRPVLPTSRIAARPLPCRPAVWGFSRARVARTWMPAGCGLDRLRGCE